MGNQQIVFQIDDDAAQAFKAATSDDKRKLEALLSIQLIEAMKNRDSLKEVMSDISRKAQERGMTWEILESALHED